MRKDGGAGESASVILFGRSLFWNDKCDDAFVEGVVIRVLQFNQHFVRTGGKTHQDDSLLRGPNGTLERAPQADPQALLPFQLAA